MTTARSNALAAINHIVVLMLENRSFDHMLGFLYADSGKVSPAGQQRSSMTSALDGARPVLAITDP